MNDFKTILKDAKFEQRNGQDIDFDKVRSVTINKEDIRGGTRLITVATYDSGTRFELAGEYSAPMKTALAKAEPVKIVGEGELKQGEAVVSTAAPTASAPGAIKQTAAETIPPSALTAPQAAPMTGPVKSDK